MGLQLEFLTPAVSCFCFMRTPLNRNASLSASLSYTLSFSFFLSTENKFLGFKPSRIAASIICVARICTGMSTAWNQPLEKTSSYSLDDLQPVASLILR